MPVHDHAVMRRARRDGACDVTQRARIHRRSVTLVAVVTAILVFEFEDVVLGPHVARDVPLLQSPASHATASPQATASPAVILQVTTYTINKPLHTNEPAFVRFDELFYANDPG